MSGHIQIQERKKSTSETQDEKFIRYLWKNCLIHYYCLRHLIPDYFVGSIPRFFSF